MYPNRIVYPPEPGRTGRPCAQQCSHFSCNRKRRDADQPCRICQQPIGYGNKVYLEAREVPVHADCLESLVESKIEEFQIPDDLDEEKKQQLQQVKDAAATWVQHGCTNEVFNPITGKFGAGKLHLTGVKVSS